MIFKGENPQRSKQQDAMSTPFSQPDPNLAGVASLSERGEERLAFGQQFSGSAKLSELIRSL